MTPEQLLMWAEKVERAVIEKEINDLFRDLPLDPPKPPSIRPGFRPFDCHGFRPPVPDCGCALNTVCMSTACPRRIQVTYGGPTA